MTFRLPRTKLIRIGLPLRFTVGGEGFLALLGDGRPNVKVELELRLGLRGLALPEDSVQIISCPAAASIVLDCSLRVRVKARAVKETATVGR